MDSASIIILSIVAATVIVAGLVLMIVRKRQTQNLRKRFGPEYDRVVSCEGDTRRAEQVLEFRQTRREKFIVRPLSQTDRSNFRYRWNEVESRFAGDPKGAVNMAESLVTDVMQARGYPTADFDQQAADISVEHPVVVQNYRAAHEIALRYRRGQASTEDLRNAMAHYRALFQELLDDTQPQKKGA
jgi:hypothetical protein